MALKHHADSSQAMRVLAVLLSQRAQFRGTLEDYDRAEELLDRAFQLSPEAPESLLARSDMRATFHRFDDALADLAQVEKRGVLPENLAAARASIDLATGRLDEALALREKAVAAYPNVHTLGALAGVLAALGRTAEAEATYAAARAKFRDVSPFPLAWLLFQEGLMWERQGVLSRARDLYEVAHARLPVYAPAAAHLAGVLAAQGERAEAIALLRPLLASSTDPEYVGQLASLLREAGDPEADALHARAAKRYDELLARHPAAFADHAARFFLATPADGKRALKLAEQNLAGRKTVEAYELVLDAALAAAPPADACVAADRALAACGSAGARTDGGVRVSRCAAHLHVLASRAFSACGQAARAADELAAAAK